MVAASRAYVRIGNSCSSVCSVISGVPQGSVLVLYILFTVYVNDICELVPADVTVKLFADDTIPVSYILFSRITPHVSVYRHG